MGDENEQNENLREIKFNVVDEDGSSIETSEDNNASDDTANAAGESTDDEQTDDTKAEGTSEESEDESDDTADGQETSEFDWDAEFEKAELSGQYPNKADVFRAVKEKEQAVTQLQQENAELRNIFAEFARKQGQERPDRTEKPPEFDPEAFIEQFQTDPQAALRSQGVVTIDQLKEVLVPLAGALTNLQRNDVAVKMSGIFDGYEDLKDVAEFIRTTKPAKGQPYALPAKGVNPRLDRMLAVIE